MAQFDDIIKSGFLSEAIELLEKAETRFLELESDAQNRDVLDDLFRLNHTVKSSAYAAGFEALGAFVHMIETLLNLLREGKRSPSPQVVDLLLRSNDSLRRVIASLSLNYNSKIDFSDVTSALRDVIESNTFDLDRNSSGDGHQHGEVAVSGDIDHNRERLVANPTSSETSTRRSSFELPKPPPGVQLVSAIVPTILLCDDEPEIVLLAAEMLKFRFPTLNIITAADGLDALRKMKDCRPHVIITDMQMPNLNGIEFVREVRRHDASVPVIFFSAYADRDNMIEFIKLGVMDFQDKPIDPDRLCLSVATALKLAQNREGIARLSTLNFKAYMSNLRLSQLGADQKVEAGEVSQKVKLILDEVAVLSNFMLGL